MFSETSEKFSKTHFHKVFFPFLCVNWISKKSRKFTIVSKLSTGLGLYFKPLKQQFVPPPGCVLIFYPIPTICSLFEMHVHAARYYKLTVNLKLKSMSASVPVNTTGKLTDTLFAS